MKNEAFTIDAGFSGGNIRVERIVGDLVELRQDLRDTEGSWFYWCFRVRGAEGRRLSFRFLKDPWEKRGPIGVRGPAISVDGGATWRWLGQPDDNFFEFTYAFLFDQAEVRFGMGMAYTQEHLDLFLRRAPAVKRDVLAHSRKGRQVEKLTLGRAAAPHAVLITARHHCCEMMASHVVEGILQEILAGSSFLRENAEIVIIPFVDKDGVEDGDQGKNRLPRDHNRDYDGVSVHPECAAIRKFLPEWVGARTLTSLDIHCPWLRGGINEKVYQVGQPVPLIWQRQQQFGQILEGVRRGSIIYRAADDLPFGQAWNTPEGFGNKGTSTGHWAAKLPFTRVATALEVPYASASGCEVNQSSARELGRDLAAALERFLSRPQGHS